MSASVSQHRDTVADKDHFKWWQPVYHSLTSLCLERGKVDKPWLFYPAGLKAPPLTCWFHGWHLCRTCGSYFQYHALLKADVLWFPEAGIPTNLCSGKVQSLISQNLWTIWLQIWTQNVKICLQWISQIFPTRIYSAIFNATLLEFFFGPGASIVCWGVSSNFLHLWRQALASPLTVPTKMNKECRS